MARLLVLNVGSASLKTALFDARSSELRAVARASLDLAPGEPPAARLSEARALLRCSPDPVHVVGHRIVHGGRVFFTPTPIDERVEAEIERLAPLAPLHQAPALSVVRAARRLFPKCTHVAVFDTAFHAERPAASLRYALPEELVERLAFRRASSSSAIQTSTSTRCTSGAQHGSTTPRRQGKLKISGRSSGR